MTWPLAADLGSSIAWDLGDPVFNSWVMLWTGGQVLAALRGDTSALHQYWQGNIFHPSSTTIAYSEHMTPQMLQGLPILAATGNIVLVYNLLFLSTFVLSGLGAYLLVREITKRPAAAFLAGLAFAFAPYRISQYSHLQVLSAQWMPFALYGFHRYFSSGRTRPLVGASAALLLQNLSCGYYLLFFSPLAAAYCVFEMAQRGLLRSVRTWRALLIAAAGVGLATWPFLSPYLSLRTHGDVGVRSYDEALQFSADVYAFGTAADASALWGGVVRAFPRGEGELFPGFTILAFALVALVAGAAHAASTDARSTDDAVPRRWALAALAGALAISVGALLWMLLAGSLPILVEGRPWRDSTALLIGSLVFALIAARDLAGRAPGRAWCAGFGARVLRRSRRWSRRCSRSARACSRRDNCWAPARMPCSITTSRVSTACASPPVTSWSRRCACRSWLVSVRPGCSHARAAPASCSSRWDPPSCSPKAGSGRCRRTCCWKSTATRRRRGGSCSQRR